MSVLCGWASTSEKGTKNGAKGDQTGREVKTGAYYSFGQNQVIRFNDSAKATIAAKAMKAICDNNNIGYGQNDRKSLYDEAKSIGWNVNRIGEINLSNVDCSEACAVAINFAYGKALIDAGVYTGNIANACKNTGYFSIGTSFSENTLHIGDMPLKAGKHIIMALANGSGANPCTVTKSSISSTTGDEWVRRLQKAIGAGVDGKAGKETLSKCPTLRKGMYKNAVVGLLQERLGNAYKIGVTGGYDCNFGTGTYNAVVEFQRQKGLTKDGCVGQNTWKKILGL